jgi:hypothetical protein
MIETMWEFSWAKELPKPFLDCGGPVCRISSAGYGLTKPQDGEHDSVFAWIARLPVGRRSVFWFRNLNGSRIRLRIGEGNSPLELKSN